MGKEVACGFHCIKAKNIGVTIGQDEILKNVNLHIHCKELTVIIGRNGAGKTTLLKALLGEVKHTGSIEFVDTKEHIARKLRIGYVPQSINVEKHMPTTVYDLFASYISNTPIWLKKDKKAETKIKSSLRNFGVESLIDKSIGDLSGGEMQRVLLAISTYNEPNLLILDEPISGIDKNGIAVFFEYINKLKKEHDMSIILVSHDLDLVEKYADRVILLDKTILKEGTPVDVFSSTEFKRVFE
ncbi:MAG: metal ABC transporter ATP-binding protein [Clostridia bacterium]|nr:metal ABC transporter ATP-binding protein [Clostridia bacterium]